MHNPEALMDFHSRCHEILGELLTHCSGFPQSDIDRRHEGFGYETVRLQLHHIIGAEKYWFGVLQGRIEADDDEHEYKTVEALKTYREAVFEASETYLKGTTAEKLNLARSMMTWDGKELILVPAQVIIRTQVHIFHHIGQILAMCRLMGKPRSGLDYRHTR